MTDLELMEQVIADLQSVFEENASETEMEVLFDLPTEEQNQQGRNVLRAMVRNIDHGAVTAAAHRMTEGPEILLLKMGPEHIREALMGTFISGFTVGTHFWRRREA